MSAIGASFFIVLALAQLRSASVVGVLLAAQSGLAAFRLVFRNQAGRESSPVVQVIAWISALLPLTVQTSASGWWSLACAPGLVLNIWALASLGALFSISPADRGLAISGPYRLIRHPMYAGELAALIPAMLADLSTWNLLVGVIFLLSILWRIEWEEGLIENYWLYKQFVRWALIPGLW